MNKTKRTLSVLATFIFIIVCATAAQALAPRTFVAGPGIGNDANAGADCPFSAPCRFFQTAFNQTSAGGEIIALTPGAGYAGLVINKAITVTGLPGQVSLVSVTAGGTGFVVSAGASDTIVIRNIHFIGGEAANSTGLRFNSGKALHVENCSFNGLDKGIYDAAAPSLMYVNNSTFSDDHDGVFLEPTAPMTTQVAKAFIENCHFENYFQGLVAAGRYTTVTVRNSKFAGRSKDNTITYGGIIGAPTSVGTTHIMIENCLLSNNYLAVGTKTDGVSFISLSQNVIYDNQVGMFVCCLSKMITFGNNRFEFNADDGSFNLNTSLK